MLHSETLHLVLPGFAQGGRVEYRDFLRRADVRAPDRHTLELEAEFPDTLARFDIELKPGVFEMETLYEELREHPGGKFVKVGPLDLSFSRPPRMVAPMLAVTLDGELYGKMWFEMPSVEDIRARKLGGSFALEFPGGGRHTIRIEVDEAGRGWLDFSMLERITVRRDARAYTEIAPAFGRDAERPWLFLGGLDARALREWRATTHAEAWAHLAAFTEAWVETLAPSGAGRAREVQPGFTRGIPMLGNLAFLALVEEEGPWLERLVALLESRRRDDRFLDPRGADIFAGFEDEVWRERNRWLLGFGWNDYGFAFVLLDYLCAYQWLKRRLPEALRAWVRENLVRYSRELYRFILFQRQYGGAEGYTESHNIVAPLAVAAAGAALREEAPGEAPRWLRFGCGRIYEALELAPSDGRASSGAWGPGWLAQAVELLREVDGRDETARPYFRNLATALWRLGADHSYYGCLLTQYAAAVLRDPLGQWCYRRTCERREGLRPGEVPVSYLSFLWHTTAPGREPAKSAACGHLFEDTSFVQLAGHGSAERLLQYRLRGGCAAPVKQGEEGERAVSYGEIRRASLTKPCTDRRKQTPACGIETVSKTLDGARGVSSCPGLDAGAGHAGFRLTLQCGPATGRATHRLESYPAAHLSNFSCFGGFGVSVRGVSVIPTMLRSYVKGLRYHNAVCVDGDGYRLEGMYLFGRTETVLNVYIRSSRIEREWAYVDGIVTAVYRPELHITLARRQWFFDARHEWALVLDELESADARDFCLHLHSTHGIEALGDGRFLFSGQPPRSVYDARQPEQVAPATLHVQCFTDMPARQEIETASAALSYVLVPVKTRSGQEQPPEAPAAPVFKRLVCRAVERGRRARFLTVLSPHAVECERAGERIHISNALGERTLVLDGAGVHEQAARPSVACAP